MTKRQSSRTTVLGETDTICSNLIVVLEVTSPDEPFPAGTMIQYEWIRDGVVVSNNFEYVVSDPNTAFVDTMIVNVAVVDTVDGMLDTSCLSTDMVVFSNFIQQVINLDQVVFDTSACDNQTAPIQIPHPLDEFGNPYFGNYSLDFNNFQPLDGPPQGPASFIPASLNSGMIRFHFNFDETIHPCHQALTFLDYNNIESAEQVPINGSLQGKCVGDPEPVNFDMLFNSLPPPGSFWMDEDGNQVDHPVDISQLPALDTFGYSRVFPGPNGCPDTSNTFRISIQENPEILSIEVSPPEVCDGRDAGAVVMVDTTIQGGGLGLSWLPTGSPGSPLPGGTVFSGDVVTSEILSPGSVSLFVTQLSFPRCRDTLENVIIPNQPEPIVELIASDTVICLDESINLMTDQDTFVFYFWDLDGGVATNSLDSADLGAVNWAADGPGLKNARVRTQGGFCLSEWDTVMVNVLPVPNAGTVLGNFPRYCEGEGPLFNLNDLLDGEDAGGTWLQGSTPITNPVDVNTLSIGVSEFQYIVESQGCADTSGIVNITVLAAPEIITASSTNTSACQTATGSINGTVNPRGRNYRVSYERVGSMAGEVLGPVVTNGETDFEFDDLEAGNYQLTIRYTNPPFCESTFSTEVVVSDPNPPAVAIVASDVAICIDDVVELSADNNTYDEYTWNLDGGQADNPLTDSDLGDVNWVSAGAGAKSVTLTAVQNGCISELQEITITVQDLPTVSINTPDGTIYNCTTRDAGGLDLIAQGSDDVLYNWSGPMTGGPNGENDIFTTNRGGTFSVEVTSDDALGCKATSNPVTVTEDLVDPVVSVSPQNGNTELTCTVESIDLTATATGAGPNNDFNFLWNGGENVTAPVNTIVAGGSYVVTVTNGRNGCVTVSNTVNITVDRNDPVVNGITGLDSSDEVTLNCDSPSASLTPQLGGVTGLNILWTGPGTNIATNTLSLDQNDQAGVYNLAVTDPENQCNTTLEFTVIRDFRLPEFNIVDNANEADFSACEGNPISLMANVSNGQVGDGTTFDWSMTPTGLSGTNSTFTIPGTTPSLSTPYTVSLTVEFGANGCSNTEQQNINVFENPLVNDLTFEASSGASNLPNAICNGGAAILTGDVTNGDGNYDFRWERNNAFLTNNVSAMVDGSVTTTGITYSLEITDGNGCTDELSEVIRVFDVPVVGIRNDESSGRLDDNGEVCQGEPVELIANVTSSTTAPPYNYAWSTTETGPSIMPGTGQVGTFEYVVTVTDARNCISTETETIQVRPQPTFFLSVDDGNNGILCSGEAFDVVASNDMLTYVWNGNGFGTSEPVLPFPNGLQNSGPPAPFTTTAVGSNNPFACSNEDAITLVINANPDVSVDDSSFRFQEGFGGMFTTEVNMGENLEYSWTVTRPDGEVFLESSSSPASELIIFDTIGIWTTTLTVEDDNGCSQTTEILSEVSDGNSCEARFRFNVGADDPLCLNESYVISDQSRDGSTAPERISFIRYEFVNETTGDNRVRINGELFADGVFQAMSEMGDLSLSDVEFLEPGEWTITQFVSNSDDPGNGCSDSFVDKRTILDRVVVTRFDYVEGEICEDDNATLVVSLSDSAQHRFTYRTLPSGNETTVIIEENLMINIPAEDGVSFEAVSAENLVSGCITFFAGVSTPALRVNNNPVLASLETECLPDNANYQVTYVIETDNDVAYTFDGADQSSGEVIITEPLVQGTVFTGTVIDENGCQLIISEEGPNCECTTMIGVWEPITVCQDSPLPFNFPDSYISDGDDRLQYELLAGGNVVFTSGLVLPNQDPGLPAIGELFDINTRYSVIVTSANEDENGINTSDVCAMSVIIPVTVLPNPELSFMTSSEIEVCNGEPTPIIMNVALPAGAASAAVDYQFTEFEADGSSSTELIQTVVLSSGPNIVRSTGFTKDSRITVSRMVTTFIDGTICEATVPELSVEITVTANPSIRDISLDCEPDNENYRVSFEVGPVAGTSFRVEGNPETTLRDGRYVSEPIPIDESYNLTVVESELGCSTAVPISSVDCECTTMIGDAIWNEGRLTFCQTTPISITERPGDFSPDDNDRITYLLTERTGNGPRRDLDRITTDVDQSVTFPSIAEISTFEEGRTYEVIVFLGNDDGSGPENSNDRCLKSDTFELSIVIAPTPAIEVLDLSINDWRINNGVTFCQGTNDVQFRVRNGQDLEDRYQWNIRDAGGTYFDNPFANPSYLSLILGNTSGNFTLDLIESLVEDGSCTSMASLGFTIDDCEVGEDRLVYLIDNGGVNVLVVTGDEGCSFQWGFVELAGTNTITTEAQDSFQSWTLGAAFIPDTRLYFVDVTCPGSATTRYYYNREQTQVNPPINGSPVSTNNAGEKLQASVKIIPNPNAGAFNITLDDLPLGRYQIRLANAFGRVLQTREFDIDQARTQVQSWELGSQAPPGMYFLHLIDQSGAGLTSRILIQR